MKVPTEEGADVSPQAMPTPYNGTSFAPVAQGLQQVSGQLQHIYERASSDRATQAELKYGAMVNDANWNPQKETSLGDISDAISAGAGADGGQGTGPTKGFLLRTGQDAVDPSAHLKRLSDARQDIIKSLADNPEAQRMFAVRSAAHLQEATRQAEVHSGQQIKVVAAQTAAAVQQQALDTAGLIHYQPGDPGAIDDMKLQADHIVGAASGPLVKHWKHEEGLPDAVVNENLANFKEQIYGKAIETLVDARNGSAARELYEKVKSQLGDKAPRWEKLVIRAEHQQRGGLIAADAIHQATGDGGFVDELKALRYVDEKIADGDERKEAAFQEVKSRAAMWNQGAAEREKQTLGRVLLDVEHHGGRVNEESSDFRTLTDEGKSKALIHGQAIIRQQEAERLRNIHEARAERHEAQAEQDRADKEFEDTFRAMGVDDPHRQTEVDPKQLFPSASDRAIQRMLIDQGKARKQLEKDAGAGTGDLKREIDSAIAQVGYPKAQAEKFKAGVKQWYDDQKEQNDGKPPTREAVRAEMSRRLTIVDPGTFSFNRPRWQLEEEGKSADGLPAVAPEKQKYQPLRNASPSAGAPLTVPKAPTPGGGSPGSTKPPPGTTGAKPPQQVLDARTWLNSDAAKKDPAKAEKVRAKLKTMGF